MDWNSQTNYCAGCGVEISVGAVTFKGKIYCCQDCLEGRPCDCGERMEAEDHPSAQGVPANQIPS
jgi:hypothetical protein